MLRKILKIIVNFFTCVVFGILILVIFAKVNMLINKTNYFKIFGYSFFSVSTGSMEPTINQNDIIIVKETKSYKVNDIVTYQKDDDFITHRITIINSDDNIVTKGDANNTSDGAISKDVIIGKVVKILRKAAIWQKVFTTPSIIITIFITLMLFDFAISYKGFKKKQTRKLVDKVNNIDLKKVSKQSDDIKLSNAEINALYNKIEEIKNDKDVTLDKKENEFLEYTIGLDLNEIKKHIADNIEKEDK